MHGELIELNERLQKMLNIREHQLRRLREELVNLRGPVSFLQAHLSVPYLVWIKLCGSSTVFKILFHFSAS